MLASVVTIQTPKTSVVPAEKQLDEAAWQAWLAKGRARNLRSHAALMKVVKWVSIGALLAAAGTWLHPMPYDIVVRFIVTGGAIALMSEAFQTRSYALAAAVGTLVLLYNPVAPPLDFTGGWLRAAVLASSIPFVTSLAWRNSGGPNV